MQTAKSDAPVLPIALLSVVAAALLLASQASFTKAEQDRLTWAQEHFRNADSNGDGVVEWSEIRSVDDGVLSEAGWNQRYVMSRFDYSGDNALQEHEYLVFVGQLADRAEDQQSGDAAERPTRSTSETTAPEPRPRSAKELAAESVDDAVAPDSHADFPAGQEGPVVAIANVEGGFRYFTPESMVGLDVVNLDGDRVGEVEEVVTSADGTETGLVIEVGGFFGLGATEIFAPVEDFYIVGVQLVLETLLAPDAIEEEQSFQYDEENYSSL